MGNTEKPNVKYVVKKNLPTFSKKPSKPLLSRGQVEKLKTVGGVLLGLVAVGGMLTLAAAAPNAVQLIGYLPGVKGKKKWRDVEDEITKAVYYLKKQQYIELTPAAGDYKIKITQRGREKIQKFNIKSVQVPSQGKWDGKWWVTIADVPINERSKADYLRQKFRDLGFYPLQKTVWVYPYDPRDQVDFISAYYKLDKFLTFFEADLLDPEDENDLLKFFKQNKILK